MMPANAGVATAGGATALSGSADPLAGLFGGLLDELAPQAATQALTVPVSDGTAVPVADNSAGTVSTAALQDSVSRLMAGLLSALDTAGTAPATGAEHGSDARTTASGSGKKPQDVDLNADSLQMALLIQVSGSRMLQVDNTVEPQTAQQAAGPSATATGTAAEAPAPGDTAPDKKPQDVVLNADGTSMIQMIQANSGRMPQDGDVVVQQAVDISVSATAVTSFSNGGVPDSVTATSGTAVGAPKGLSEDSSPIAAASRRDEPRQTAETAPQPTLPALSAQPVAIAAGQNTQTVGDSTISMGRGEEPGDRKADAGSAAAPVSPSADSGKADTGVRTAASTGAGVKIQPQQEVTLVRSASLEVALTESVPQNEVRTTGQALNVSAAQNTPMEIPAASAGKTTQAAVQQDLRAAKSDPLSVPVALSSPAPQPSDQAATTNNRTLEGARSVQAAVAPAAEKMGAEIGGETLQARFESAVATKPVQNAAVETASFAGTGTSAEEFSTGDDKGTADSFMNGQFHATLMHQQGSADGTSAAGTVSAPAQSTGTAQQSGLSEQILQQVKDRLANHEVKAGNDQIVLKLSPENLGDLKLNLSMDGQRLKVEIVAENHMVRDALLQNSDSLKETLARQNISMESFDVTTNGRGAGNPGQGQQQQNGWREFAQQQKQQNAWMSSGGYGLPDVAAVSSQLAYQTPSQHAMVDLHF
jgi:flagellar hook-length control protein FliK